MKGFKKRRIKLSILVIVLVLVLFQISGCTAPGNSNVNETTLSEKNIQTTSLSTQSAAPGQLLTVYGKGFDRTSSLYVHFTDEKGYDLKLGPVQIIDNGVIVAVPPYVNFENYAFASGTVNVQIVGNSEKESVASNPIKLKINDLPTFTEPSGTITLQFIDDAIVQIEDTKRHMLLVENISGGSFSASDSITSLNKLALGYAALRKEVESVMADKSKQVPFAKIDGQTLYYNQETLATADRLFGSLMEIQSESSNLNAITGIPSVSASSVKCGRLEGLDLSVVIACVQKRISVSDGVTSMLELANEKHFKNPLLEKGLGVNTFLSDVTFLGLTLPATLTAYNSDLAAITYVTGKEESEIASGLRDYYLDGLALKVLDRMIPYFGSALGIISDLTIGPTDVLYRSGFNGMLAHAFTRGLAYQIDPNTMSAQTGLNLIVCDICGKKQKDFAVMAGVSGNGKISSIPAGISCPGDCNEIYGSNVASVELSAKPEKGYVFEGWSLACSGKGRCMILSGRDQAVIATFVKESENVVSKLPEENLDGTPDTSKCPKTSTDTGTICWSDSGSMKNSDTALFGMISAVYVSSECNCPIDTIQKTTNGSSKRCECKR